MRKSYEVEEDEVEEPKIDTCPLCQRTCELTFHHLIPKMMHRRTRFKKQYSKEELKQGIEICRDCHDGIHMLYDETTLATKLNSLVLLTADEKLMKHVKWVSKQK